MSNRIVKTFGERMARWDHQMMPGTLGGRSRIATPATPVYTQRPSVFPFFPVVEDEFLETFTGADGVLGVTTTDLPWNAESGQEPLVTGNQGGFSSSGYARAEVDVSSDMFVECDWVDASGGFTFNSIYLFARAGDAGGIFSDEAVYAYISVFAGSTDVEVGNWSGSGTSIYESSVGSPFANWRLEVSGTTARVLRDGVEVLNGSIADFSPMPAGTRGGFAVQSASTSTPTPTTITESFDKADGTTIGPDLTWSKTSFIDVDCGVIDGNAFAVVGANPGDLSAQCRIGSTSASFVSSGTRYVEAEITAKSAYGSSPGLVLYTAFYLWFGSVNFQIDNNGEAVGRARIDSSGGMSGFATGVSFAPGDVIRLEIDGSNNATAKVNGSTVQTLSGATGGGGAAGCTIEVSQVDQGSFTADAQDKLDNFEASGTVNVTSYELAIDNWKIGSL